MKYFNLYPSGSWGKFSRNSELANLIYNTCLEKVNEGGWNYINIMSNMGIFEDESENYLCLETYDKGDINLIHEMHVGFNEGTKSSMRAFIDQLKRNFNLLGKARN